MPSELMPIMLNCTTLSFVVFDMQTYISSTSLQDTEHECELPCGKKLQCGLHDCQETCHRGHCPQCLEYSESI